MDNARKLQAAIHIVAFNTCLNKVHELYSSLQFLDYGLIREVAEQEEGARGCSACETVLRAKIDMMETITNEFKAYAHVQEKNPCKGS